LALIRAGLCLGLWYDREHIACAHVESAIAEHPNVVVVGHPDEEFGEALAAG